MNFVCPYLCETANELLTYTARLTLKLVRIIAHGEGGQPSYQFWCF